MRRCGSTTNGKMPAPSFTTEELVREGGSAKLETGGPMQSEGVAVCTAAHGGGPKNGAKKNCWKGGFPRVSPSNWPKTRSWKIPWPARIDEVLSWKGSHARPTRGSKSSQSLLKRGGRCWSS